MVMMHAFTVVRGDWMEAHTRT